MGNGQVLAPKEGVLRKEPNPLTPQEALTVRVHHVNREHYATRCRFADPSKVRVADVRAEIARLRIPIFTRMLLDKMHVGDGLTGREVELLYCEYRQYFKSNPPFRESLQRTVGSTPGSSNHDAHLLRQLVYPEKVHKRTAHSYLSSLMKARLPYKFPVSTP